MFYYTFFRTFYREKTYALINLLGLSLAIACCLVLVIYLKSELTYDQHHEQHERIFRVVVEFTLSGPPDPLAMTQIPLGPMLKENYSEIEDFVRFSPPGINVLIRSDDLAYFWDDVYFTDPSVFDIFSHEVLYGEPATALDDPAAAAVSESFAIKYFGDAENAIGKTITPETAPVFPRRITLVYRDLPDNSHLKYSVLLKFDDPPDYRPYLFNVSAYTYLLMPEGYDIDDFQAIGADFFSRFMAEQARQMNASWRTWLEPVADIHLNSDLIFDLPTGNKYYIYGFAAVAIFILLVACINYVNLAIARSTKRGKTIAMRKILGASRSSLVFRYLGEAILFSMLAMAIGVVLVKLLLSTTSIAVLMEKPLVLDFMEDPALLYTIFAISLLIGLLSGLYPAVYLSSVPPLSAMVNTTGGKSSSARLREILVLIQFIVSFIVIACTMIMAMQINYITNLPMGFEKENRVIVPLYGLDVIEKFQVIKDELLTDSRILGVSISSSMVSTDQMVPLGPGEVANNDGVMEITSFGRIQVGENFHEVMGIELLEGRDFSRKFLTDVGTSMIVNETMVRRKGWDDPIGKQINLGNLSGKVVGVVKDFNIQSLRNSVEPVVMFPINFNFDGVAADARATYRRLMVLKIAAGDARQTLDHVRQVLLKYDSKNTFDFEFLDASVKKLYTSEDHLMKLTGIFSMICIFISCLGLFGLAAFNTEQRSREIGIRKVLGANTYQIISLLAKEIVWLVLAGSIIASIISFYAIDQWLSGFAYRMGIQYWVFIVTAVIVTVVAYITIALQSYKTASANPTLSIRHK